MKAAHPRHSGVFAIPSTFGKFNAIVTQDASPHFSPGAVMIAEDFGPVYTRGQKTREGAASAVRHRHDHRHRGQTSRPTALV